MSIWGDIGSFLSNAFHGVEHAVGIGNHPAAPQQQAPPPAQAGGAPMGNPGAQFNPMAAQQQAAQAGQARQAQDAQAAQFLQQAAQKRKQQQQQIIGKNPGGGGGTDYFNRVGNNLVQPVKGVVQLVQNPVQAVKNDLNEAERNLTPYMTDAQGKVVTKNGKPVANPNFQQAIMGVAMGAEGGIEPKPEILNHYTTPEAAKALKNGAEFDYNKTPQHGMGGKDALIGGKANDKFVNDGGPALYLSRDDKSWSTAQAPTGKGQVVNIDKVTPEQIKNGYLEKNGITPQFDYKQQKYVGVKNATKTIKLEPVQHQLDPSARTLNIDSPTALHSAEKEAGTTADDPNFWARIRQKYDVVNIKNARKNSDIPEGVDKRARNFFRSAKADQAVVLNPNVVDRIEANGLPASLNREYERASQPITPENNPDQWAEMMDNVEPRYLPVNKPTPDEIKMGKALGMSKSDVAQAKEDYHLPPEKRGDLPSSRQMNLAKLAGNGPKGTPLAPAADNTAKNPYKAPIPEVKPGDYGQVISNEHVAAKPVESARDVWRTSMQNLRKANPDEYKNFWRHVEDTPKDASPELKTAIQAWREADNRVHGTSQALGGNTNYLTDHALHPWQLPEEFTDHLVNGGKAENFPGINNISRKYRTVAEGEANGLKLGDDPMGEGTRYLNASAFALRRRAILKGIQEADAAVPDKTHTLQFGQGAENTLDVSKAAHDALRGLKFSKASDNAAIKGLRTANTGLKGSILSVGQFHPINISVLRAGPATFLPKPSTLIYRNAQTGKLGIDPTMSAHPVAAVKGMAQTFAPLVPKVGKQFAQKQVASAVLKDYSKADATRGVTGRLDVDLSKIGFAIGTDASDAEGASITGGLGHHKVFAEQMPMMHIQVGKSILKDLERRGISLDSPEARVAGKAANNLMGFVDAEVHKVPPSVTRKMGDWLLAKQFTHSKGAQLRTAVGGGREVDATRQAFGTRGVGGAYARANVTANVAASLGVIVGLGYAFNQKSDNLKDMLLRALLKPSVPTPMKDGKGNTINLRLPATDTSDVGGLLGLSLVRGNDGHLGVSWDPANIPGNVRFFMQARLAPLQALGLDIKANKNFAGYKMYNDSNNASMGERALEAGLSSAGQLLPIAGQGVVQTKPVQGLLPKQAQKFYAGQKPGTNPLIKSIGSSFGLTSSTDMTVGKGADTAAYYKMRSDVMRGASADDTAALNKYFSRKVDNDGNKIKEGTVGGYNNAKDLLNNYNTGGQALQRVYQGEHGLKNNDPLWKLPLTAPQGKPSVVAFLQAQQQYEGPEKDGEKIRQQGDVPFGTGWIDKLNAARNDYYKKLGGSGSAAPANEPPYPDAKDPQVAADMKTASAISDPKQWSQYVSNHQDVVDQMIKQERWTNQIRSLEGGHPLPITQASPQVQALIKQYDGLPASKSAGNTDPNTNKQRSNWIKNNPDAWKQIQAYYAQSDFNSLLKNSIIAAYSGENQNDQKLLKDIKGAAQNVSQDKNGNYTYDMSGSSGGGSGSSSKSKSRRSSGSGSGSDGNSGYIRLSLDMQRNKLKTYSPRKIKTRAARDTFRTGKIKAKVPTKGKLPIATF